MEIFNAFRGEAVELHGAGSDTLDGLKSELEQAEAITAAHMLLLVAPQGQQLKALLPSGDVRILLYDKSWTERQPESKVDLDAEIFDGSSDVAIRNYIARTHAETAVTTEATQVAVKYLRHQLRSANKLLKRHHSFRLELEGDVDACSQWERYWDAMANLPALGAHLPMLLDREAIASDYGDLSKTWAHATTALDHCARLSEDLEAECASISEAFASASPPSTDGDLDDQFRVAMDSKSDSQTRLLDALRRIGSAQLRIAEELRKPLAVAGDELKKVDDLKAKIAEVIDLPFLYGALLIEVSRREKWSNDFEPLRRKEQDRQRLWLQRYSQGAVGNLVRQLGAVSGFDLDAPVVKDARPKEFDSSERVASYLSSLQVAGLDDVYNDLRSELGAMQRQLARSLSASISSLMPSGLAQNTRSSPSKEGFPSSLGGAFGGGGGGGSSSAMPASSSSEATAAAYESRIKKLENVLMQTKLGSKAQELEVIRAETRAEARAEARAEVKAEQMSSRITELETLNQELSTRLQTYTNDLETILNAMGLQTSRVDPETGEQVYKVNRVKGLSRRTSPPSTSSEQASAASQTTGGSTHGPHRLVAIEKFMDQTVIDSKVLYEAVTKRFGDVERLARKLQSENRTLKERYTKAERDCRQRVALHSFRPEDLILFLPTRDPRRQPNPWAAFNAGAPHYFLHPRHAESLKGREYLIARAAEIERRVVASDAEEDNPFGLSAGVEWYLITAHGEWGV